ncbi:MAG: GNAT family N-acetyltransferase [Myxococcaceae bacterium]|nr:GNAT family N-acetyltransferase [Myxococcaceae bacterium]
MNTLCIRAFRTISAAAMVQPEIDALNEVARRPCPFSTFEYLKTYLTFDEYGREDDALLLLGAFEGKALVGFLPLRERRCRWWGLPYRDISFVVTHDTDRPHVVCRPEDELRCGEAFFDYLLNHEKHWSSLELGMQDVESGLNAVPPLSKWRHYGRRFENMPNTTVPLPQSLLDYYRALPAGQRKAMSRYGRRLMQAGHVEAVSCSDPRARHALLNLYLDLEHRSWKEQAHAGIRRHPLRIEKFHALCGGDQPMQLGFDFVVLDALPIAGMVSGAFGDGLHALEMSFDGDYEAFGPGHLLTLMVARRGIAGHYRFINYDGNYSYYKARLGGVVTPTWAIQIYRTFTVPWVKALLGALKRRLERVPVEVKRYNPVRRQLAQQAHGEASEGKSRPLWGPRPARLKERSIFGDAMRTLETEGVPYQLIQGAQLEQLLPFLTRREAA